MRFFLPSVPAGRLEYLVIVLVMNVAQFAAIRYLLELEVIDPVAREISYNTGQIGTTAVIYVAALAVIWITVLRRLTDLNMGSMAAIALFIPVIAQIFQLWLLLAKGIGHTTIAPYGDDPYDPQSWVETAKPGANGPAVTYKGQALRLPGEEDMTDAA
jgi:uncharacterized membrane protein YhaH (DUF805 family)